MTSAYGDINYETVKVHVPNGKKKLYLYANEWKRFTNITDDYDSEAQVEKLIKAVFDLIAAIGKIEYSDDCKEKIEAACAAYNALTAEQKALVKNYNILIAAEEEYDKPKSMTGIADINAENTIKDGKYLKNGRIVIIKNGRKYNSNGLLKM